MNDIIFSLCCCYPMVLFVLAWTELLHRAVHRGSNDLYIMLMVRFGLKRILFDREEVVNI